MLSRRTGERGAALLVVIVAVAVLTMLAAQLAYDTRVSLQIAANARDELRATYLAKSGVSLSRLVLSFQQQIDDSTPPNMPRLHIWRLVPVGSTLANSLFPGGPPEAANGAAPATPATEGETPAAAPAQGAGGEGFEAKIEDEAGKVNAQLDALTGVGNTNAAGAQVQALYQLICDARWDALFDREDENGLRVPRQDLLIHLRDWIDDDEQGSALAASFPAGGCSILLPPGVKPFEPGFQDENSPYDRGESRYRAKNARMDSLDELYMIAGIGDAFMSAFRDSVTVYLPPNAQRNVNQTDRDKLVELATIIADPPAQQALLDPKFAELLQKEVMQRTFGGLLAMSAADFGGIVQSLNVSVNMSNSPFTDRSSVFGIRAEGKAGAVSKTLDVVVRLEKAQVPPSPTPGRVVHWREE